jgi:membrane protease YdiL (CAAX protease family)
MTDPAESPAPREDSALPTAIPDTSAVPSENPSPQAGAVAPPKSLPERIFLAGDGVRMGWRLGLYLGLAGAILFAAGWLGNSIFPNPHGTARLWFEMYSEVGMLLAGFLPALLLARIEHRPVDDYGLPRSEAFARRFWIGLVWGFAWITALLLLMHGAHVFSFGRFSLHGVRIARFALFWAVYFLLVGLFEEFFVRGYLQFTLTRRIGFWPAAVALSAFFGGIHLLNQGETLVGALGAALIGLFFCLTLRRTGSLWFAVGFHASWDWGETYFYGVPDSGTTEPGHLLSPTFSGKAWLTGGSVGPEASVLLLIVIAAMWLAFHLRYRQAHYPTRA